jgi:hypothetical protein
MLRRRPDTWAGFQVLVDHRKSGSIGGFFGNGTGGFHAVPYLLDARYDAEGRPIGLRIEDPDTSTEPMTPDKPALLTRRGDPGEFLTRWRFGDWNALRIQCVGAQPTITTRVNDVFGGRDRPRRDGASALRRRSRRRRPRACGPHRLRSARQRPTDRAGALGPGGPMPVAQHRHQRTVTRSAVQRPSVSPESGTRKRP